MRDIAGLIIPPRRERTCPRAVKRARHNNYRVKKPDEPASIRHPAPATIRFHSLKPTSRMINLSYVALSPSLIVGRLGSVRSSIVRAFLGGYLRVLPSVLDIACRTLPPTRENSVLRS